MLDISFGCVGVVAMGLLEDVVLATSNELLLPDGVVWWVIILVRLNNGDVGSNRFLLLLLLLFFRGDYPANLLVGGVAAILFWRCSILSTFTRCTLDQFV